jgi:hypothetical protein
MKKRSHVDIFMHILHLTAHKQHVNQHIQVGLLTLLATVRGGGGGQFSNFEVFVQLCL